MSICGVWGYLKMGNLCYIGLGGERFFFFNFVSYFLVGDQWRSSTHFLRTYRPCLPLARLLLIYPCQRGGRTHHTQDFSNTWIYSRIQPVLSTLQLISSMLKLENKSKGRKNVFRDLNRQSGLLTRRKSVCHTISVHLVFWVGFVLLIGVIGNPKEKESGDPFHTIFVSRLVCIFNAVDFDFYWLFIFLVFFFCRTMKQQKRL